MTNNSLKTIVTVSFLVVAVLGIAGPVYTGAYEVAFLGLYAAVPLLVAPALYHVAIADRSPNQQPVTFVPGKKPLGILFFGSMSTALVVATTIPRPRWFFIALSLCNTVALVYCLKHGGWLVPLSFVSLTTLVFHLSTTATKPFYIASGDTSTVWLGVQHSLEQGRLIPHAGYDLFPAYYSLMVTGDTILGLKSHVTMLLIGAGMMVMVLWLVAFISKQLSFVPTEYVSLPSVLLTFMYNFYYAGLYTIPRKGFGLLAVLPLVVIISALYRGRIPDRYKLVLLVSLGSLIWFHKVAHIWFFIVIGTFTGITLLARCRLSTARETLSVRAVRSAIPVRYLLSAFVIGYLYVFFHTPYPQIIVGLLTSFLSTIFGGGGAGSGSGMTHLLRNPIGMFLTLVDSAPILLLFLLGILATIETRSRALLAFTCCTTILAVSYFPGPAHFLLGGLSIDRMGKFVLTFVAIVAAIGLITAWERSNNSVRLILIVLIFTGGVFALSSDLYTRDNPVADSGTFTNYLTEPELHSTQFGGEYTETISTEARSYDYLLQNYQFAVAGEREHGAEPTYLETRAELCENTVLFRGSELDRRGFLTYHGGIEITAETEIPNSASRSTVYHNGHDKILAAYDGQCPN